MTNISFVIAYGVLSEVKGADDLYSMVNKGLVVGYGPVTAGGSTMKARVYRDGSNFLMETPGSAPHTLWDGGTDAERLWAHWTGFTANVGEAA